MAENYIKNAQSQRNNYQDFVELFKIFEDKRKLEEEKRKLKEKIRKFQDQTEKRPHKTMSSVFSVLPKRLDDTDVIRDTNTS
tara:strand:+ start:505 stop:750 length:246 start_codon:yes stop_codon:yes gene_type:complete